MRERRGRPFRIASGPPLDEIRGFTVGKDVAVTPRKVALLNKLIELTRYAPTAEHVRRLWGMRSNAFRPARGHRPPRGTGHADDE
ncbi:MAG: hypothetical protein WDN46_04790 [Methylocella sp.]